MAIFSDSVLRIRTTSRKIKTISLLALGLLLLVFSTSDKPVSSAGNMFIGVAHADAPTAACSSCIGGDCCAGCADSDGAGCF